MNWPIYVNWLAGPLLQITLLIFMVRSQLQKTFPRFFSYILLQTLKSACLFIVFRYLPSHYFEAYWTGNALSVIFTIAVMDEILRQLSKQYGGAQILGTTIFRWSCGLLLLLAVLGAFSAAGGSGDRVVAVVFAFERSIRLMQIGLFLVLMILCRIFRDCWKQQVFGIALGFGIFASIELILVSFVMWYGHSHDGMISLLKGMAFNTVTAVWIGYLRHRAELVPMPGVVTSPSPFGLAFATPDPEAGFMLRVEDAVDRVLSRSNWPRPVAHGSQIVGRKPTSEEGN
jgi:hypothetical protein